MECSMDPKKEYQSRVSEWSRRAQALEQAHLRMGNLRIFFVIGLFVLAAVLCRSHVALGFVLTILIVGLFLTGMRHIRIENARDSARRAIRFYQSGLERLDGTWMGKGSHGTEFLDRPLPSPRDLDCFGQDPWSDRWMPPNTKMAGQRWLPGCWNRRRSK